MSNIPRTERIGEKSVNNQGSEMILIDYINYNNCTIKFPNGVIREKVNYYAFIRGEVKDYSLISVNGVGIVGEGLYKTSDEYGKPTRQYSKWKGMISRCYS